METTSLPASCSKLLFVHWLAAGVMLSEFGMGAYVLFWQGSWAGPALWATTFFMMSASQEALVLMQWRTRLRPTFVGALLYAVSGFLRCRIIRGPEGEPYLERYALFEFGRYRAFIHRFVASDPDRGLHDHPWNRAVSLILSGRYTELRLLNGEIISRQVQAGDLNFLRGEDFHRVVLPGHFDTWSLFMHGPRAKGWGFVKPENGIPVYQEVDAVASSHKSRGWASTAPIGWRADRTPLVIENTHVEIE